MSNLDEMSKTVVPASEITNLYAGVDIGSTTSEAVLINDAGDIVEYAITDTKHDRNKSGEEVLNIVLDKAGKTDRNLKMVYSTGYGRRSFERSDQAVPEVICHARGTAHLYPNVKTIIDIGGQDAKLISMAPDGTIAKFEMNDKCAAGTGRFFEVLSRRLLNVQLDDLGPLALTSKNPCLLSSTCTVFAESEIVSYLSAGVPPEDIAMGILESIARRIWAMGSQIRIRFDEPIIVSGGLAKNIALKKALEEKFEKTVYLADNPQIQAALGAALSARDAFFLPNNSRRC
ncbi:MAG TPA: acyl-CoA dehydratase activase [Syntrophomonadaceae bacterium]|nr:acyl-CoA dehydratase activase [Syntrophomonadaceae bacterium]